MVSLATSTDSASFYIAALSLAALPVSTVSLRGASSESQDGVGSLDYSV